MKWKEKFYESPIELWKNLGYCLWSYGMNPIRYDIQVGCYWYHPPINYPDVGYKREGTKQKRLLRTYLSAGEIDKFNKKRREVVKKKKDFVLLFRFGNKEKRSTKVGDFCIIAATFVYQGGNLRRVNIYYRTTEAVTKFLADLIFLDDVFSNILFLEMTGVEVKFYFAKVYLKYFHFLNFTRICKNFFGEDPSEKISWGKELVEKAKKGFSPKYCAGKRIAERFREEAS